MNLDIIIVEMAKGRHNFNFPAFSDKELEYLQKNAFDRSVAIMISTLSVKRAIHLLRKEDILVQVRILAQYLEAPVCKEIADHLTSEERKLIWKTLRTYYAVDKRWNLLKEDNLKYLTPKK